MNNRRQYHKMTGIYRTSDNIENFKLRVTFRTIISLIKIPSFNPNITDSASEVRSDESEVVELAWQEKRFSCKEIQAFQYKENCKTDLEKDYHQLIRSRHLDSGQKIPGKLFTYTTEDKFDPDTIFKPTETDETITIPLDSSSQSSIQFTATPRRFGSSLLNTTRGFETFYIMAELNIEVVLIVVQWRKSDGLLVIYPDFNNMQHSPYLLEVDADTKQMYHFSVENISSSLPKSFKFPFAESKFKSPVSSDKKQMILPSERDYNKAHLLFQIVNGTGFEYDNLHVRFTVKIPPMTTPMNENCLLGSTHSSYKNSKNIWNFSFCHDVSLQSFDHFHIDDFIDLDLRVISIDEWKRERIEGYGTLRISIKPGLEMNEKVECYRLTTGSLIEKLERFFIGDKKYQEEFEMKKTIQSEGISRYGIQTISTGEIRIKVYLILQSRSGKIMNKSLE